MDVARRATARHAGSFPARRRSNMARSHKQSMLMKRRKRAKTLERLRKAYANTRREERARVVEKLGKIAPWLKEEYLQTRAAQAPPRSP
jgi:hypothetical protein